MTNKQSKILEFFKTHGDKSKARMDHLKSKMGLSSRGFTHWASWNLTEYVHLELLSNELDQLVCRFKKLIDSGKMDEEMVAWLKAVQAYYVRQVLDTSTSHSSSVVSNLVEDIRVDMWRELGGGLSKSISLTSLLSSLEG